MEQQVKKIKHFRIAAAVVIVIICGIFVFRKVTGGSSHGFGGGMGMDQTSSVTIVKAEKPTRGDVSVTTQLTGTVEAEDVVYVYAKASGDVTAVHKKAGDIVEKGDILLEINTEQVESAKNQMDSAQVQMDQANSNLSRMKILYDGADISAQEYEQYENTAKSARLSYESAKLNYDRQVEYSSITAPIAGRIETMDVDVYDRVGQSTELCVITGSGEDRIVFYVTDRMVRNLSVGDQVDVLRGDDTYTASISEISTIVDSSTGLFKVKASMPENGDLATGSCVKLSFVSDKAEDVMLVPINAIYYSGGDGFVYLYDDGHARMTAVDVGLYDDSVAQITGGLSEEDIVVSTWSSNLYEGADIRLLGDESTEETDAGSVQDMPADMSQMPR